MHMMMPSGESLHNEAARLLDQLRFLNWKLTSAESCTGGLIMATLTDVAGSSDIIERGFITYSNEAKSEILGVPSDMILSYGAVSDQVARAMAQGALQKSPADLAISVTGVAGPGGGTYSKPVGLVYLAAAHRDGRIRSVEEQFGNFGRTQIRKMAVRSAFQLIGTLMPH
jgi:nicotinamide-nucleotide amidase